MQMTEQGFALIREFEGFRAKAYRDPVGIWTIGYGHTSAAGPPEVTPGLTVSEAEARIILERDVAMFADGVGRRLTVAVNSKQFSALVSFAYNVGLGNFGKSSVLKAVNAGDFARVPERLKLWNKADGRVLPGLVRRRAAEAALFKMADEPQAEPPPISAPVSKPLWRKLLAVLISLLNSRSR